LKTLPVAGMILTTECALIDIKEETEAECQWVAVCRE
jgi:hypothetical protein